MGVVESGSECVVLSANPWDALGYQAVEDAVTVFNHGGYAAATALLDSVLKHAEKPVSQAVYTQLHDGFCWLAQFDHASGDGWRLLAP